MINYIEKFPMKKHIPIRMRIRHPKTFDKSYKYRPIPLEKGITAIVGIQKGQNNLKVQTLLFNTDCGKNQIWSIRKAKVWLKENKPSIKSKIFLRDVVKSIRKAPPKLIDIQKAVNTLNKHFNTFPRRLNKGE